MTKIINFKKLEETLEDKRQGVLDEVEQEVNDYVDDMVDLIQNNEYGETLQNKISGIVVIVDFENQETTTQIWASDEKLKE